MIYSFNKKALNIIQKCNIAYIIVIKMGQAFEDNPSIWVILYSLSCFDIWATDRIGDSPRTSPEARLLLPPYLGNTASPACCVSCGLFINILVKLQMTLDLQIPACSA